MDETTELKSSLATFGVHALGGAMYKIDLSRVANIPMIVNGELSTFRGVLKLLRENKIQQLPRPFGRTANQYLTDSGTITVQGQDEQGNGLLSLLGRLATLVYLGANIDLARWFYYEFDMSSDPFQAAHIFFVIDGTQIIDERFVFFKDDPVVLKDCFEVEANWTSQPHTDKAWEIYWYRRFYSESMTGQLMVLRPDEPYLYHFQRPTVPDPKRHARQELLLAAQNETLRKMYHLLWVFILLLAAIAFPSIRWYMASIAILAILRFPALAIITEVESRRARTENLFPGVASRR